MVDFVIVHYDKIREPNQNLILNMVIVACARFQNRTMVLF